MAEISKLLDEKTAAAETSIDVNELNALVEKLKLSTDELTKVVTNP